jgi:bile acid:Na+ symporter, BASS family
VVMAAGPAILVALITLHTGGFTLGYLFTRGVGLSEKIARTNSIETGMQNSAVSVLERK